jgi:hypothetical protein
LHGFYLLVFLYAVWLFSQVLSSISLTWFFCTFLGLVACNVTFIFVTASSLSSLCWLLWFLILFLCGQNHFI